MSKRTKGTASAPMLLKLCAGGIIGWWRCLRCGWELPGQLNPENHNCRADYQPAPKRRKVTR